MSNYDMREIVQRIAYDITKDQPIEGAPYTVIRHDILYMHEGKDCQVYAMWDVTPEPSEIGPLFFEELRAKSREKFNKIIPEGAVFLPVQRLIFPPRGSVAIARYV